MHCEIPAVIQNLYGYFTVAPNPEFWPDCLQYDPVKGHGLYSFYMGLRLGLQIAAAGLETA